MKKIFLALAFFPFLGAGCWSTAQNNSPTAHLQVPGQVQQQPQTAVEVSPTVSQQPAQNALPSEPLLAPNQSDYIKITDQKANGDVMLDYVLIHKRGFAVILDDKAGRPDGVVAASDLLNAGEIREAFIKTKLQAGRTYWIGLYADNGDGRFNAATDVQIRDSKDAPVMARFTAE